ncbi:conjugal transfer protein TrbL family protein [Ruminococcus sp.]|jgi:hypothetical protein
MLDSLLLILADIFQMDLTKDLHYTIAQFMSVGLASWTTDIINQNNNYTTSLFENSMVTNFLFFIESFAGLLLVSGIAFAVFDFAVSVGEGERVSPINLLLNLFKGLLASLLITTLPVSLLIFTNHICNLICQAFTNDSAINFIVQFNSSDSSANFFSGWGFAIFMIIAFICVIKVFLANIKRGGILIIQMFVGALHLFSIPRGYLDSFSGWCKQVIGICATSFISNILIVLGAVVYCTQDGADVWDLILAAGVMLAAAEAPRILQQFGLDTSVKANVSQAIFATSGITSIIRSFAH